MKQEVRSLFSRRKKPTPPAVIPTGHSTVGTGPGFQHYQSAVQLLQQGKYEKAMAALERMLPTAPPELIERCKMYIQYLPAATGEEQTTNSSHPEERCDYAVSMLNTGYYEEAREQFNSILATFPDSDFAFYGLALLDSITGRSQDCLRRPFPCHRIEPRNRLQARADNDFQSMVDDPRFTELLYPEVP